MWTTLLSDRSPRIFLAILAGIALVGALQYAQNIVAPMVFAIVLGSVVSPIADKCSEFGIPRTVIASAILVFAVAMIGIILLLVEPLVGMLIEQLPRIKATAQSWLAEASDVLRGIETISEEIEKSVGAEKSEKEATSIPSLSDALWLAPSFLSQVFIFVGTLFFFVLTRNELYAKTGEFEPKLRQADRTVARYFAAITLVNAGLGAVTTVALTAAGVSYAPLWGLAAGLMNFILYLGPMLIVAGLTIAGMVQFHGIMAFLPPFLFLLINLTEANFVTPLVVGKRLNLNPMIVFLAIVFGLWLWGPIGAIVILPVLLWSGVMLRPDLLTPRRLGARFRTT